MSTRLNKAKDKWRGVKASKSFHNTLVFIAFIGVATLFWFILALNDSVTRTFDVGLRIVNIPDSVTFITDPPKNIHVTLRDKGTNVLRAGILQHPSININFRDYTSGNLFRFTKNDMNSFLRALFGSSSQIGSVSTDSLYLYFTTGSGHQVPVVVRADLSAAPGKIISGQVIPLTPRVKIYSLSDETDTITRVYTEPLVKRHLEESEEISVRLQPVPNAKLIPSVIKVKIPVEPLVKKEALSAIKVLNEPEGISLLLFPAKVPVSYYVPMSHFNDDEIPVTVTVDYEDTEKDDRNRLTMSISGNYPYVISPEVDMESVEYTLVKE